MNKKMESKNKLYKALKHILGPGTEKMLGDGKGGASSLFQYQMKNTKPITAVLMAPSLSVCPLFNSGDIEPISESLYKNKNCLRRNI